VSAYDPYRLPSDLPVPADDGAAEHLLGLTVPHLRFPATTGGELDLAELASGRLVLFCYPRTGRPGVDPLPGWDAIPGARGCTPQACAYRDHHADLVGLGASVVGLSAQTAQQQREFAERSHIPFPLLSDPGLELSRALRLPTFTVAGQSFYRRLTFVAEAGTLVRIHYPVFPPDTDAERVVEWLRARSRPDA